MDKAEKKRKLKVLGCVALLAALLILIAYVLSKPFDRVLVSTLPNTGFGDIVNSAANLVSGAISTVFSGILEMLLNLLMQIIVIALSAMAQVYINAMQDISISDISGWFGNALNGNFERFITSVGYLIVALFTVWELFKYVWSNITGQRSAQNPRSIIFRSFAFAVGATAGIAISKAIFRIGQLMYSGMYRSLFGTGGYTATMFMSGILDFFSQIVNMFTDIGNDASLTTTFGVGELASDIFALLAGTVLLLLALWEFLKLLFSVFTKFATLIFYVYMSPLTIACGASQTWQGVFVSWLKNYITTLFAWIMDVWCMYACLSLLTHNPLGAASKWAAWAGCCYGFAKGALRIDELLRQLGMQVAGTSGSVMGDVSEMIGTATLAIRGGAGIVAGTSALKAGAAAAAASGAGVAKSIGTGSVEAAKAFGMSWVRGGYGRGARGTTSSVAGNINDGVPHGSFKQSMETAFENSKNNIQGYGKNIHDKAGEVKSAWENHDSGGVFKGLARTVEAVGAPLANLPGIRQLGKNASDMQHNDTMLDALSERIGIQNEHSDAISDNLPGLREAERNMKYAQAKMEQMQPSINKAKSDVDTAQKELGSAHSPEDKEAAREKLSEAQSKRENTQKEFDKWKSIYDRNEDAYKTYRNNLGKVYDKVDANDKKFKNLDTSFEAAANTDAGKYYMLTHTLVDSGEKDENGNPIKTTAGRAGYNDVQTEVLPNGNIKAYFSQVKNGKEMSHQEVLLEPTQKAKEVDGFKSKYMDGEVPVKDIVTTDTKNKVVMQSSAGPHGEVTTTVEARGPKNSDGTQPVWVTTQREGEKAKKLTIPNVKKGYELTDVAHEVAAIARADSLDNVQINAIPKEYRSDIREMTSGKSEQVSQSTPNIQKAQTQSEPQNVGKPMGKNTDNSGAENSHQKPVSGGVQPPLQGSQQTSNTFNDVSTSALKQQPIAPTKQEQSNIDLRQTAQEGKRIPTSDAPQSDNTVGKMHGVGSTEASMQSLDGNGQHAGAGNVSTTQNVQSAEVNETGVNYSKNQTSGQAVTFDAHAEHEPVFGTTHPANNEGTAPAANTREIVQQPTKVADSAPTDYSNMGGMQPQPMHSDGQAVATNGRQTTEAGGIAPASGNVGESVRQPAQQPVKSSEASVSADFKGSADEQPQHIRGNKQTFENEETQNASNFQKADAHGATPQFTGNNGASVSEAQPVGVNKPPLGESETQPTVHTQSAERTIVPNASRHSSSTETEVASDNTNMSTRQPTKAEKPSAAHNSSETVDAEQQVPMGESGHGTMLNVSQPSNGSSAINARTSTQRQTSNEGPAAPSTMQSSPDEAERVSNSFARQTTKPAEFAPSEHKTSNVKQTQPTQSGGDVPEPKTPQRTGTESVHTNNVPNTSASQYRSSSEVVHSDGVSEPKAQQFTSNSEPKSVVGSDNAVKQQPAKSVETTPSEATIQPTIQATRQAQQPAAQSSVPKVAQPSNDNGTAYGAGNGVAADRASNAGEVSRFDNRPELKAKQSNMGQSSLGNEKQAGETVIKSSELRTEIRYSGGQNGSPVATIQKDGSDTGEKQKVVIVTQEAGKSGNVSRPIKIKREATRDNATQGVQDAESLKKHNAFSGSKRNAVQATGARTSEKNNKQQKSLNGKPKFPNGNKPYSTNGGKKK